MRKFACIVIACALACACSPRKPLSVRVVESEMSRWPEASYIDGMQGKLKWNYTTGLELRAMLDVFRVCGDTSILNYVDAWYDAVIAEDGSIGGGYRRDKYNLDHICPGCTLFDLYELTGKPKYRAAIDTLYLQICSQPRTEAGAFWHKKIYPGQVWLDGLYMAEPFYARYNASCIRSEMERGVNFDDIADQFRVAYAKTYDPATGLCRHAWDETGEMFWSDPYTGRSAHAWGRAMGWYVMALCDVIPFFPEDHPALADLKGILRSILKTLPEYADPETGMWYQVLDCPGREGNYVEATCSAMFTFAYLKAVREGWLPESWAKYAGDCLKNLQKTFVHENPDGTVSLERCCAVAGLGGKQMRSGDYDYYIHESVRDDDPKGIGPLIWAALETERKK